MVLSVYQPMSPQKKSRNDLAAGRRDERIRTHHNNAATTASSSSSSGGSSEEAVRLLAARANAAPNPPLLVNAATITGGEEGRFNVYKISVPKTTVPPLDLGLIARPTEWLEAEMLCSSPSSPLIKCLVIDSVENGSLADRAGVLPKDVLLNSTGGPSVFEAVRCFVGSSQILNGSCLTGHPTQSAWFEECIARSLDETEITFYVARKKPMVTVETVTHKKPVATAETVARKKPVGTAVTVLPSIHRITLSAAVAARAEKFASLGPEEKINLLEDVREDAKQQFEDDRDVVLASLSPWRKRTFNVIHLALRGEDYQYAPALVLSPYSLPPGDVRNRWLLKYEMVRCGARFGAFCWNAYGVPTLSMSFIF
jgi:hypothetical protein